MFWYDNCFNLCALLQLLKPTPKAITSRRDGFFLYKISTIHRIFIHLSSLDEKSINSLLMKNVFLILLLFMLLPQSNAQEDFKVVDDLKFYADVIANAGNPIHRERANDKFSSLMDEWINSDAYTLEDLESIQWLSVKQPDDSTFTIVTWQLEIDENKNKYYGYLIKDNEVLPLKETTYLDDLEYDVLSNEDWAGALYYNILTVQKGNQNVYILFGYNAYKDYSHRKIADVLTFDAGKPVFGSEIFKSQKEGERAIIKNRLILDYSNDANVSLNFNPSLNMIVHDHLIPRLGRVPGQGFTLLPDGSYVGYQWDGEYFNYIEKIYDQTQEEPPMPKPILGKSAEKRDIFGKQKQKKNLKKN